LHGTSGGRIGADLHLAGKPRLFGRLLYALSGAVELPAVIDAAYVVALDPAEMHLRAAVRTAIGDDLRLAALAAVQREILAHDPDRLGPALRQILAAVHWHPEPPHEPPARRVGPGAPEVDVPPRQRDAFGPFVLSKAHPVLPSASGAVSRTADLR